VLVTGAAGFVGRALCAHLRERGFDCLGAVRDAEGLGAGAARPARAEAGSVAGASAGSEIAVGAGTGGNGTLALGDFAEADWDAHLAGVDAVVHAAALAHRPGATEGQYVHANVDVTRRLVDAAVRAGVRRLVFASSVKVNGEETPGRAFREDDPPRPEDAYGRTKRDAEAIVRAAGGHLESVILRFPLVYGPGVRGNFLALVRAIDHGLPLPVVSVRNARSLLFLGNLVSAVETALVDPAVAGGAFLLADGEDLDTRELCLRIGRFLGRKPLLLPLPAGLLRLAAAALGQTGRVRRLTGSLTVDTSRFRALTGWTPPYTVDDGIAATVRWYREQPSV
jgi:nucleoside-diphosphate-sugar epimerase